MVRGVVSSEQGAAAPSISVAIPDLAKAVVLNIVERFQAAWAAQAARVGPDLLPTALARSLTQTLRVTAAGISVLTRARRLPIGASSPHAAIAESWQFTLGDGPCFAAVERAEPVIAREPALRESWPALHDELRRHTPFRSVVVLPLGRARSSIGAVDLYFDEPGPHPTFDLEAAEVVTSLVHARLLDFTVDADPALALTHEGLTTPDGTVPGETAPTSGVPPAAMPPLFSAPLGPAWMANTAVQQRQSVWLAIGMMNAALAVDAPAALALLRARAYAEQRLLDDLVHDVITGRIPVQALRDPQG